MYNINEYIWFRFSPSYKRNVSKLSLDEVKIDTKERFHAITLPGPSLSATMTEELDPDVCFLTSKMTLKAWS